MNHANLVCENCAKWLDALFLTVVAQGASASVVSHNFGDPATNLVLHWYGLAAAYVSLSTILSNALRTLSLAASAGLGMGATVCFFQAISMSLSSDATSPIRWVHWLILAFCFIGRMGSCGRLAK